MFSGVKGDIQSLILRLLNFSIAYMMFMTLYGGDVIMTDMRAKKTTYPTKVCKVKSKEGIVERKIDEYTVVVKVAI